jgi:glycosyltransferase involved in cell wall biosynthesis
LLETTGIFALPSLSEGLPMAILEAFSYGIPVVATPVNAIPDVVKHEKNPYSGRRRECVGSGAGTPAGRR